MTASVMGDPPRPSTNVVPTIASTPLALGAGGLISFNERALAIEAVSKTRVATWRRYRIIAALLRFGYDQGRVGLRFASNALPGRIKLHSDLGFPARPQTEVALSRGERVITMGALAIENGDLFKPQQFLPRTAVR